MERKLLQKSASLGLILLAAALSAPTQQQQLTKYTVISDWRISVGPRDSAAGHLFRLAVCQDGSTYLSDGLGRLTRVGAAGDKLNDQSDISEMLSTLSLACDEQGRAVAGSSKTSLLSVLQPKSDGTFFLQSQIKPDPLITPFDILPLPENAGYAILGNSSNDKSPLHIVSQTGEVQSQFGAFNAQVDQSLSFRTSLNGTLLRHQGTKSILYFPENPYKMTQFTATGQTIEDHVRADAEFHPVSLDSQSGLPLPNDRVVRAAVIGTGDLLVQVVKHPQTAPMTVSSTSYLEVVDTNLNPLSEPITSEIGHLWGSDAKGNVYFTVISPTAGMNVIKAHVSQANSANVSAQLQR